MTRRFIKYSIIFLMTLALTMCVCSIPALAWGNSLDISNSGSGGSASNSWKLSNGINSKNNLYTGNNSYTENSSNYSTQNTISNGNTSYINPSSGGSNNYSNNNSYTRSTSNYSSPETNREGNILKSTTLDGNPVSYLHSIVSRGGTVIVFILLIIVGFIFYR